MFNKVKYIYKYKNFWLFFSIFIWIFGFLFLFLIIILKTNNNYYYNEKENLKDVTFKKNKNEFWYECWEDAKIWDECGWWIVFYIWKNLWSPNKKNILVSANTDQPQRAYWSLELENFTWASNSNYWYPNTKFLVKKWSQAANVCWNKNTWWFDDWYLPSSQELYQIWKSSSHSNWVSVLWNFTDYRYWSSTQSNNQNAFSMYFSYTNLNRFNKRAESRIRCIREVDF